MSADAHMQGGGFMGRSWGVLDFAGGDVVHISSGAMLHKGSCLCRPRSCLSWELAGAGQCSPQSSTDT